MILEGNLLVRIINVNFILIVIVNLCMIVEGKSIEIWKFCMGWKILCNGISEIDFLIYGLFWEENLIFIVLKKIDLILILKVYMWLVR